MEKIKTLQFAKYLAAFILVLEAAGFFYFEPSWILKILVVVLGIISLWQLQKAPDILMTFLLYLGLFDFYYIHYGLAIPTAVILIALGILVWFIYYLGAKIYKFDELIEKNISLINLLSIILIVLEVFLAISLLPVDPKTKCLIIVIVYYLAMKLIYLNANRVLNLKRTAGFVGVSLVVLVGIIYLGWYLGF